LEVLGKSSWDIQLSLMPGRTITDDLRGETKKTILDLFSAGNESYLNTPLERTIQRPDGSRCIIESAVFIYRTRENSIAVTISTDITSRKMIEEDLRKSHSQLRSLTSHIEKIREDERAAIAREMHDELGQILTSLKMNIAFTRKAVEAEHLEMKRENLLHELQTMNSSIDTAVAEVRKLITQLRPDLLDKLGLLAALEWYSEEFQKSTKISCSLKSAGAALSLSSEKDLAVFRIVQEAMTNIVKYAGASFVNIRLESGDNKLIVEISDDGKGISEEEIKGEKSFGLMGMRERAVLIGGKLEITGTPGRGTLVRLILNM
jgi:signal transduction histidine kinase